MLFRDGEHDEDTPISECLQLLSPDQIRFLELLALGLGDTTECRELEEKLDWDKNEVGMAEIHILGLVELISDRWEIEPRGHECLQALGYKINI